MLVRTFGFHLLQLDVRQESGRHTAAAADILMQAWGVDYAALDEAGRLGLLQEAIANAGALQLDAGEGAVEGDPLWMRRYSPRTPWNASRSCR